MKKHIICLSISLLCTVFLVSCQSTNKVTPPKIVSPQAPYLDENIEVVQERVDTNVDRTADVSAHAVHTPVRFWDTFTKRFRGVSDKDPYERPGPYRRDDYKKDL